MKIGIHTSAIGVHVSGGILCIVEVLNRLAALGHDVRVFVDEQDTSSQWLVANFPIIHSSSEEYTNFDGVLITPFSPTAQAVSQHPNASHKLYWVHSNEAMFGHNGEEWTANAVSSYCWRNMKLFCVSSYLQILMNQVYGQKPLGTLVPPGVDVNLFQFTLQREDRIRVGFLHRQEHVRGSDTAVLGCKLAQQNGANIEIVQMPLVRERHQMAQNFGDIDVYVDASRLAGSPTPVKEAMSCGTIPICTYIGTTDFVYNNINGFIISPDDPKTIASLLVHLSSTPIESRQLMAQEARNSMESNWTWDIITQRFLYALNEAGCAG
jgi:hypothetical protein